MWIGKDDFIELVEWRQNSKKVSCNPDINLARKLKLLNSILRNGTIRCIVGWKKGKKKALNRLKEVYHFNGAIADENAVIFEKETITSEREEIARKKEISWRQKSRCLLVIIGDKYTKWRKKLGATAIFWRGNRGYIKQFDGDKALEPYGFNMFFS